MKLDRLNKLLIILTIVSSGTLLISNLVATKLWNFFGFAVDGGVVLFPIIYIIGDLIMEIFGKKIANFVVYVGMGLNIFASLIFWIVGLLPEYPNWGQQAAYQAILGFVPRVVVASLMAYLLSSLMNNFSFEKISKVDRSNRLYKRALGSSAVARAVDTLTFESIAYFGVLSFQEFLSQMLMAYVIGMILETLFTPGTYLSVKLCRRFLAKENPKK